MKKVNFFPWAKPSAVLGYGTTSFMSAASTQKRLALLETAFDAGITHFDTAPLYGYGEAERLMGTFLQQNRDKVTITTKFGIEPSGAVKARWVNLTARKVLKLMPGLKKVIQRKPAAAANWGIFDPKKAQTSLDRSLQALRTDYVDLLLMHEPKPEDAARDDILAFLEQEVARGRIRAYGCGGEWSSIGPIFESNLSTSQWLQCEDNIFARRMETLSSRNIRTLTFAPFNQALQKLQKHLKEYPSVLAKWRELLDLECNESDLAQLLQASCHSRNANGIVLFSSSREDRIRSATLVAEGNMFQQNQLQTFDRLTQEIH